MQPCDRNLHLPDNSSVAFQLQMELINASRGNLVHQVYLDLQGNMDFQERWERKVIIFKMKVWLLPLLCTLGLGYVEVLSQLTGSRELVLNISYANSSWMCKMFLESLVNKRRILCIELCDTDFTYISLLLGIADK